MTEHSWGCPVDRNSQYGEPANPVCSCGYNERVRSDRRVEEVERVWEVQAKVLQDHAKIIAEQLDSIRAMSKRIGEIAASNFALRKSRDQCREEAKALRQLLDNGLTHFRASEALSPVMVSPASILRMFDHSHIPDSQGERS